MSVEQNTTTALAVRQPAPLEPWHSADWQRLWLSLQARPWTALAIVPASSGAPRDFTVNIALTLARTGMIHLTVPIHIADATDLRLSDVTPFLDDIRHYRKTGDRILLALSSVAQNPLTETLAQHADCSLLCVLFDSMASGEAKRTIDKIGKERFIGTSIFRPEMLTSSK